jgi:hypothetical protein
MRFTYKSRKEWKGAAQRSVAMETNGMASDWNEGLERRRRICLSHAIG